MSLVTLWEEEIWKYKGTPEVSVARKDHMKTQWKDSHLQPLGKAAEETKPFDISVAQSCPTLCNPMDCSIPGFPVHHQLPELALTHVHWVGDAIQPSHPQPVDTLTLNFQPLQLWENKFLFFKPLVCGICYGISSKLMKPLVANTGDFPHGPVAKTLCSQCRGTGFNP